MEQYFEIINLNKKEVLDPHYFYNGAKLMEFSYVNNPFVNAFVNLLKDRWKGDKVCVVGDYYDYCYKPDTDCLEFEERKNSNTETIYNFSTEEHGFKKLSFDDCNIDDPKIRYFHYSDKENNLNFFFDLQKCAENIHPLPLLLALGNGQGGGDYYGENKHLVGSWSSFPETIKLANEPIKGYLELEPDFNERYVD